MFNRNLNLTLETVKNYKELNFENYEEYYHNNIPDYQEIVLDMAKQYDYLTD